MVILPQTVHFTGDPMKSLSVARLRRHRNLHVLVRDRRSRDILSDALPDAPITLVPDMASFLYPLETSLQVDIPAAPGPGILALLREDIERVPVPQDAVASVAWRGDWKRLLRAHRIGLVPVQAAGIYLSGLLPAAGFAALWQSIARKVACESARRFAAASRIVTSRLHGHILAALVRRPSVIIENSYGKNLAYASEWHNAFNSAPGGERVFEIAGGEAAR